MRRVVITGMGAITPVGLNVDASWSAVRSGRPNFTPLDEKTAAMGVRYAGQVQDFDPIAAGIPKKEARRYDRYIQFAQAAADEAVSMSGFTPGEDDPFRLGVMIGSGIGGFHTFKDEHIKYLEKGASRVSVFFIPMLITNMASGCVAIKYGFKGQNFATVSACASGAHAIGEAFRAIKHGYLDCALAGGSEACVDEFALAGFNNMGALSRSEDPLRLSIPFDKERGGFVMSEGSGVLFLEEYEHARRRGAKIYAEIIGYGATCDAHHITAPSPDGEGAAEAMRLAIQEGAVTPADIGYINAHGTATPANDACETSAIHMLFGEHAGDIAVSSTKSVTGHMLGAAGAVEAIFTAKALCESIAPPTAGYRVPDPECDLDYVTEGTRPISGLRCALSNAFGFGGQNAALCLAKVEEA